MRAFNTSDQPVFDVLVRWHNGTAPWSQGGKDTDELVALKPKEEVQLSREWGNGGNYSLAGVSLEFRDTAGVRWRRTRDGALDELLK
ncbi:hypothetical protein [Amycolatopsis sp.]|uniref:hypothetical protein n=1 Tax=Amycolatopsis sp. TaxID=37632 RepID=UPI0026195E00|nr:hypothetical protein [Amycolatopsis sp.]